MLRYDHNSYYYVVAFVFYLTFQNDMAATLSDSFKPVVL